MTSSSGASAIATFFRSIFCYCIKCRYSLKILLSFP
jgi:hypothetical protein